MSSRKKRETRNGEESATRQRRRIIIATTRPRWNHFPRASRVIKLCGSPARYLPSRSPSYSSFSSLTRFLPWTWIHFFPFNSASTYLPCSIRHGPPSRGEEGGGGGGEGCCEATVAVFTRWRTARACFATPRDRRRQLEVRRIQGNCSFDG